MASMLCLHQTTLMYPRSLLMCSLSREASLCTPAKTREAVTGLTHEYHCLSACRQTERAKKCRAWGSIPGFHGHNVVS